MMVSILGSLLQKVLNFLSAFPLSIQNGRDLSGRSGLASVEIVIPRAKAVIDG